MCDACTIIWEADEKQKEEIHWREFKFFLKGGWFLNHCGGSNAHLGYLILTASQIDKNRPHAFDFDSLREEQTNMLGKYLNWIQHQLKEYSMKPDYWSENDRIEQIYFAYLNESPYKKFYQNQHKMMKDDVKEDLHVHIHILPRTQSMGEICNGGFLGWDLLKITKRSNYTYFDVEKKKHLMRFLKEQAKNANIYTANPD